MKTSLIEMFGTKADITWKNTVDGEEGTFDLDDQRLKIIVNEYEPIKLSTKISTGRIFEIGFSRVVSGKYVVSKTATFDSIKIFSIIFNSLIEKFKKNFPKTIVFSAKKIGPGSSEHDQRAKLYAKLQDRIGRLGYDKIDPIETKTGTQFILTSVKFNAKELEEMKNLIKEKF